MRHLPFRHTLRIMPSPKQPSVARKKPNTLDWLRGRKLALKVVASGQGKKAVRQVRDGRFIWEGERNFSHLQSPIGRKEIALQDACHRPRRGRRTRGEGRRRSKRKGRKPKQGQTEKKRHHYLLRFLHCTFTALSKGGKVVKEASHPVSRHYLSRPLVPCVAAVIVHQAKCRRKATMVAILPATIGSSNPRGNLQIKPKRTARAVACGAVLTLNFL